MPANIMSDAEVIQYTPETRVYLWATVAQMRLMPSKNNATWLKGQTGLGVLIGNNAMFDQSLTLWAWDATSTAADNGTSVVQPTAIVVDAVLNPTGAGRWRHP